LRYSSIEFFDTGFSLVNGASSLKTVTIINNLIPVLGVVIAGDEKSGLPTAQRWNAFHQLYLPRIVGTSSLIDNDGARRLSLQ
jgi:hypothetical protein